MAALGAGWLWKQRPFGVHLPARVAIGARLDPPRAVRLGQKGVVALGREDEPGDTAPGEPRPRRGDVLSVGHGSVRNLLAPPVPALQDEPVLRPDPLGWMLGGRAGHEGRGFLAHVDESIVEPQAGRILRDVPGRPTRSKGREHKQRQGADCQEPCP